MAGLVLVLNAGSSSLKAALFEAEADPREVGRASFAIGKGHNEAVAQALEWAERQAQGRELAAAGHRVVHGGPLFHSPQRITPRLLAALEALIPLAPLHQSACLAAVRAVTAIRASLPQVACFDTAFHWGQPPVAQRLPLPRALHDRGLRRYGFHGLSYEHIASRLAVVDPQLSRGRVVAAHLGSGASLCALKAGRSVETTMGFSPLDGLLMSTRPGQLDPGAVLYLLQHEAMSAGEVEELLYHRSGLLGVSGVSGDMHALLASGDPPAAEAVELFVHRAALQIAAMVAAVGGLDGLVFTGGIGENSEEIRARICRRLGWLGLQLDEEANAQAGERRIDGGGRARAWVIPANEEASVARHVHEALAVV